MTKVRTLHPVRVPFPLLGVVSFVVLAPLVALSAGPSTASTSAAAPGETPTSAGAPNVGPTNAATPSTAQTSAAQTSAAQTSAVPPGWSMTQYGPLSPADRDIVVRVRLAGLWEAPAGAEATRKAADPTVRQVGEHLAREHTTLDETVRSVAAQLGVALPNTPTAEQRGWLDELDRATGAQFDQIFVDRLRAAHGTVFSLLSGVRAGTRNSLVRSFAQAAVDIVMRHMTLLEGTGLVRFDALAQPQQPPAAAGQRPSATAKWLGLGLGWLALAVVLGLGFWYLLRGARPSTSRRSGAGTGEAERTVRV